jgi:hypothetical protein
MKWIAAALVAVSCAPVLAAAEGVAPRPAEPADLTVLPPAPGPKAVALPRPAPSPLLPVLKGVRALVLEDGRGRLVVDGVERDVKVGSEIRGDVVRSVAPGRIVLARPESSEQADPGALLIVRFDAKGQGRVLVVAPGRPASSPSPAPEVGR